MTRLAPGKDSAAARVAWLPAGGSAWTWRLGLAVLLLALVVFGLVSDDIGLMSTLTTVFLFVVLSEAWNILGGYGGYLNLGMAAFYGIGVYSAGVLWITFGLSPFVSAPLCGLVAAILATAIGLPALRLRGPYFAILTLILGFILQTLVQTSRLTRGSLGISFPPLDASPEMTEEIFYLVFLALTVMSVGLAYLIEGSRFGNALVAIREDEEAAEILGVRTTLVKMGGLILGAALAGVAGAIQGYHLTYIEPEASFSPITSLDVVLMTTVGGAGTWQGPLIGAPLVLVLQQVLRVGIVSVGIFGSNLPTEFNRVVFGALLVVVGLFARHGVVGWFRMTRGRQFTV